MLYSSLLLWKYFFSLELHVGTSEVVYDHFRMSFGILPKRVLVVPTNTFSVPGLAAILTTLTQMQLLFLALMAMRIIQCSESGPV